MAAAKFKLDNLTLLLDNNLFQQTGPVQEVMSSLMPIAEKWRSFGWHVEEMDGHDMEKVLFTLEKVEEIKGQPKIIICHTKKGKGLSPFEKDNVNRKHGEPLTEKEAEVALAELDQRYGHAGGQ
jgi:transketolase